MRRRLVVAVMALVMTMGGGAGYIGPAVVHASGGAGGGGNGGVTPFGCSSIREATGAIYDPTFGYQIGEVRIYKDSCSGNIHGTVVVCCSLSGNHNLTVTLYENGVAVGSGSGYATVMNTNDDPDCACRFSVTGTINDVNIYHQNASGSIAWAGP